MDDIKLINKLAIIGIKEAVYAEIKTGLPLHKGLKIFNLPKINIWKK